MKLPEEYWGRVERQLLDDPQLSNRDRFRVFRDDIRAVFGQIRTVQPSRILVWRGQANADHGLSSSLFRKAQSAHQLTDLTERLITELEAEVLIYARRSGLGRGMTHLELLRALQHYQMPTRLIDVSKDPLSALWFSANELARKDGRLFLFAVPADAVRPDDPNLHMLPWEGIQLSNWTNRVLLLTAPASNPRMAAQNGAFLVGGLARNYAGKQRMLRDRRGQWRYVPAEQIHEISEIFVRFPLQLTPARIANWNPDETYAVTWRIPLAAKPMILRFLGMIGIHSLTMYPDFDDAGLRLDEALSLQ